MEKVSPILLKNALIMDPRSAVHGKKRDILVEKGKITSISTKINAPKAKIMDYDNMIVSPGWIDMQARLGEPGNEMAETFDSACMAANQGGFTRLMAYPSLQPPTTQAAQINYIRKSGTHGVKLLASGCISEQHQGKQLAELFDMHSAGALAFSDDKAPLSTALLARALEYTKTFNGLIISFPLNHELNPGGLMHEGPTSTAMGTKGLSSTSEYMQVQRDLEILQYCGGRLHFSNISTAESVDLIRQAKKMGLPVTCGMAAHQLSFTDQDLMQFSSNLKTLPPFRQDADRQALIKGLLDDTIDVIVSDHSPAIIEDKAIEFEFASFGISALETAFCSIFTSTEGDVPIEKITAKLSVNPAEILGLECPIIEENSFANLTLFTTEDNTVFNQKNWKSKSSNSPFIGSTLRGKVLGTVC